MSSNVICSSFLFAGLKASLDSPYELLEFVFFLRKGRLRLGLSGESEMYSLEGKLGMIIWLVGLLTALAWKSGSLIDLRNIEELISFEESAGLLAKIS